jgi:hypothetical protein
MKRNLVYLTTAVVLLFSIACGSMNRATPAEWDKTSMEADVRSKVVEAVPGKTFEIGVSVSDNRVVTLTGTVSATQRRASAAFAASSTTSPSVREGRLPVAHRNWQSCPCTA